MLRVEQVYQTTSKRVTRKALEVLREQVEAEPQVGAHYVNLCRALRDLDLSDELIETARIVRERELAGAIELDNASSALLFFYLGDALDEKEDAAEALKAFRRGISLAPQDAGARVRAGELYLEAGRLRQADASFCKAIEANPKRADAFVGRADVAIEQGETERALEYLDKAVHLASKDAQVLYDAGTALLSAGYASRSAQVLKRAARLDPANGEIEMMLGMMHNIELDLPETAERHLKRACAIAPKDARMWKTLAGYYMGHARWLEALRATSRMMALEGETAEVLVIRSGIYTGQGEQEAAEDCLRSALKVSPDHVEALMGLSLTLYERNEFKEALPLVERACAIAPGNANQIEHLADLLAYSGRWREATEQFVLADRLATRREHDGDETRCRNHAQREAMYRETIEFAAHVSREPSHVVCRLELAARLALLNIRQAQAHALRLLIEGMGDAEKVKSILSGRRENLLGVAQWSGLVGKGRYGGH